MRRLPLLVLLPLAVVVSTLSLGAAPAAAMDGYEAMRRIRAMDEYKKTALSLVTSDTARSAFDLSKEPEKLRERYGLHPWGQRALMARMTKMRKDHVAINGNTPVPPGPGSPGSGSGGSKHDEGFFDRLVHAIGPGSADSVPLPLLILAGLAMLLLAAAAASLIAKRVQARRAPPPDTPRPLP